MTTRLVLSHVVLLAGFAAATSCARGETQPKRAAEYLTITADPTSTRDIVATVDSSPITAEELAAAPIGSSAPEVLADATTQHLLAVRAVAQGLSTRRKAKRTFRRALVLELIRDRYVHDHGPDKLPMELVQKSYNVNRGRYVHPDLVDVAHILAVASPKDATAHHRKAKAAAERVHTIASRQGSISKDAFAALADQVRADAAPVRISHEVLVTPREGYVVEAFAAAAFALDHPGALSPVTRTRYGYHVIYLKRQIPARNSSLATVEDEIRQRIYDEGRQILLNKEIERLKRETPHQINEAVLLGLLTRGRKTR